MIKNNLLNILTFYSCARYFNANLINMFNRYFIIILYLWNLFLTYANALKNKIYGRSIREKKFNNGFADEIRTERRDVVAEHKTSHIYFMNWKLDQPCNYIKKFIILYSESSAGNFAPNILRYILPVLAAPALLLLLSFSPSPCTLCMRTFTGCGDARNKLFP